MTGQYKNMTKSPQAAFEGTDVGQVSDIQIKTYQEAIRSYQEAMK